MNDEDKWNRLIFPDKHTKESLYRTFITDSNGGYSSRDGYDRFEDVVNSLGKYYSDSYLFEEKPKKKDDGMYELNVDTRDLIEEWLETKEFREDMISVSKHLLLKNILKKGKYDESEKTFLKEVRKDWIDYLRKEHDSRKQ
jgi:hypothetical protein